jgi:predicted enzyme related to lactoylglutathione lyase
VNNVVVWSDIPVTDLERAKMFYARLTGLEVMDMPGAVGEVALIGGSGDMGSRVSADLFVGGTPSTDGPTIYLAANGDIDGMLERAAEASGEVLREKAFMGEMVGWIAFIKDSEGNRIGLQQPGDGA